MTNWGLAAIGALVTLTSGCAIQHQRAERLVQAANGIDGSASDDLVPVEAPLEISSYKSMQ